MLKNKKILVFGTILTLLIIFLISFFLINNNKVYTISFDTDGGTTIIDQKIKRGALVSRPIAPKKTGYVFSEWQYNNRTFDFNTKVNKDMTLKAIWNKVKTYTVQLEVEGKVKTITVNENDVIDLENITEFEREGFTIEWCLDGKPIDIEQIKITKEVKLVGKYLEIKTYSISFDTDGGSEVEKQIVIKGEKAIKPENPTKEGYRFKEWQLNGKTYKFSEPITSDISLIAVWEAIPQYTVSFNTNGGTIIVNQIVSEKGKATKPQDPTKEGYRFKEWELNGKTYNFAEPVTSNITLLATWIAIPKYTISFDTNGGTTISSQLIMENGKVAKPKDPVKSGYMFKGWELNGTIYNFDSIVTKEFTLVARWVKVEPVIEAYFFNSQNQNNPENECIALKTSDNKLIVIDTANAKSLSTRQKIKKLSNTIDYLIVSHSHADHTKNLPDFLNDSELTIKNVIYKKESLKYTNTVQKYLNNSPNPNRNDIDTSKMTNISITYKINDDISLILFNLQDVFKSYSNTQCGVGKVHPSVRFASEYNASYNYYKYNGKYVYLNSLDPNDNTLHFADTLDYITGNLPNRRYYAYINTKDTLCNSNTNSIVVLVQVKTEKGYRYMYIPSDLGNNGYSFFGNERPDLLNNGFRYSKIYATGDEFIYANTFDINAPSYNDTFLIQNNALVNGNAAEVVRVEAESLVANQVRNYLGGNLHNIVIYQETHHGFNNAKDAVDTLELNRSGIYSIVMSVDVGKNSPSSRQARGYHYTLSNTTKLASGASDNGVYCTIKNDATYYCNN